MISASEFLKWLQVFNVDYGGGGTGGATEQQVQRSAFNFVVGTGSNDHFVANLTPPVTVLTDGLLITMSTPFTNLTIDPTLQVNALTPVTIVTTLGEALVVGDINANVDYLFVYNLMDNKFQIINPSISIANAYLVQKNFYNYAPDIGEINAYVGNFPVKPLAISEGLSVILQVDSTNTGASTLVLNGYPSAPIVGMSGGALTAGEILGGSIAELIYSGNYNAFVLLNSAVVPGTGTVGAGTINDLAYYASSGTTISSLATSDSGILSTNPSGVPSISNTVYADLTINTLTAGQGPGPQDGTNSCFGNTALAFNTTGNNLSAIGYQALNSNVSGNFLSAFGSGALFSNSASNNSSAFGYACLADNDGPDNCGFGYSCANALGVGANGAQNCFYGSNVGIASAAGQQLAISGNNNSWFGYGISSNDGNCSGAIGLGAYATPAGSTGSTTLTFGPGISIGSAQVPVGFRGDGSPIPAGSADYWRVKVNGTFYDIPLLPDGSTIQWPASGTLATTSQVVLLSPSGAQTITGGFDLIVSAGGGFQASSGNLTAGSSGFAGNLILFPTTTGKGILEVHASDSAAMYTGLLTNTSLSAGRTWTLPDASGTIALTSGASGIVNSGLINQLTWYAATGTTVSGLATANSGILSTSISGVPSISNTVYADLIINTLTVGQGPGPDDGTNVCLGNMALAVNTTGNNLSAAGYQALNSNTTGNFVTAFGSGALFSNNTSNNSSAFGYAALADNDGSDNCAFGYACANALGTSSNGIQNCFYGSFVGDAVTSGQQIVLAGNNNSWYGYGVSGDNETLSGTIGIGAYANPTASTGSTSITFGPGIAIGSTNAPVGFRGDGSPIPAGSADYWRVKVNGTFYDIPLLPDGSTIQWPASGTLATTSGGQQWINITTSPVTIVPGSWYVANYTGGTTVFNLPSTAAFGTEFRIKIGLAGSAFQIAQGAGQQINISLNSSTLGVSGHASSTGPTDYLALTCLEANLIFGNTGYDGNINLS